MGTIISGADEERTLRERAGGTPAGLRIALALALTFPTVESLVGFVFLAEEGASNPAQQVVYAAGMAFLCLFPVCCVWFFDRRLPRPGKPHLRGLGLGLVFGLLVAACMIGLYSLGLRDTAVFAATSVKLRQKLEEFGLASPAGFALFAVVICVPHSLLEEYYWRWFLFGWLLRRVGVRTALILSSLGFMSHHVVLLAVYLPGQWPAVVVFSLCTATGGAVWAWLYNRGGSIYAPWLSHLIVDAALFVIGYDLFFVRPA